jgi:thiol-disulfide isomerase/thioredoxin
MSDVARRHVLLGAVGGLFALGAGAAAYWWTQRDHEKNQQAAAAADAFWPLEFDTPDGQRVAMASLRGKPLVLNFWATWCPPCVREMPALDRFAREHGDKGWQVLGLAADSAAPVRKFLAVTPVGFPIVLAGFEGIELSRRLGNASGGLPFTVIFGRDGRLLHRHIGETRYEQLADWAKGFS